MKYTTEFDEVKRVCIIRVTGQHKRPQDSMALQQLARDIGDERDSQRFLFDMTQTEIIGGTIDIFQTGTVPVDSDYSQIGQRIALLFTGDLADHKFLENVAVNRGYQLRIFDQMDKALEWLGPEKNNT